jgi:hypothetical protein
MPHYRRIIRLRHPNPNNRHHRPALIHEIAGEFRVIVEDHRVTPHPHPGTPLFAHKYTPEISHDSESTSTRRCWRALLSHACAFPASFVSLLVLYFALLFI